MPRYAIGDFLPDFRADSSVNPRFVFDSLAGRQFFLAFVGSVRTDLGRATAEALLAESDWLTRNKLLLFVVTADSKDHDDPLLQRLKDRFTIFWDGDRAIARMLAMEETPPNGTNRVSVLRLGVLLIRRNLRLHATIAISPIDGISTRLRAAAATLPQAEPERTILDQAPVLLIPDVISPAVCRRLIDYYEQRGGTPSGFMRDVDGQTRGHLDAKMKRRKDLYIDDPQLQQALRYAITTRIVPEIRKAYAFGVTRIERYMIGCYDDSDLGFFGVHRDNETKATGHRVFAVSLNLNSEDYEGGALRFPEYGQHVYKPATGAAVVFACSLLHEATPVTRGRRYVVLPFLYDEAGAARRAENIQFLSKDAPTVIGAPTVVDAPTVAATLVSA